MRRLLHFITTALLTLMVMAATEIAIAAVAHADPTRGDCVSACDSTHAGYVRGR